MLISSETWAIVAATGLGPIFAVGITLWREAVTEKYRRRFSVFRTLMATRKVPISPEHVNAVNLVEVDFYKCRAVEAAWLAYKDHLNTGPDDAPFNDDERRQIDIVFALLEERYKGELQLIVLRTDEGNYVLTEPRERRPDYDRVIGKLHILIDFLYRE